jgi:hypothetical protein
MALMRTMSFGSAGKYDDKLQAEAIANAMKNRLKQSGDKVTKL